MGKKIQEDGFAHQTRNSTYIYITNWSKMKRINPAERPKV